MSEEQAARIILFVVMSATGVLLLWMARAGASGKLERNGFVGIRTASTMSSDEAWRAAHERAEVPTRIAGYVSLLAALAAAMPTSENLMIAAILIGSTVIVGLAIYGAVVGSRAAREAEAARGSEG